MNRRKGRSVVSKRMATTDNLIYGESTPALENEICAFNVAFAETFGSSSNSENRLFPGFLISFFSSRMSFEISSALGPGCSILFSVPPKISSLLSSRSQHLKTLFNSRTRVESASHLPNSLSVPPKLGFLSFFKVPAVVQDEGMVPEGE